MAPSIWQKLGGKVYTGANLGDDVLDHFKAIGGSWICPWVYQDLNAQDNIALIPKWRGMGLTVGGVFNCFGGDPIYDAQQIATIAKEHSIKLVILDLESSYQYPNPGCMLMPTLLSKLREYLPLSAGYEIGVNTNGMNDSMIWNGGQLGYQQSMNNLKIRCCPQWYSAPRYEGSPWTDPIKNMEWLTGKHLDGSKGVEHGTIDNFKDPTQKYGRAIPYSYIHFCAEPTGVEGAVLSYTLERAEKALQLGLTPGFNLFVLERSGQDLDMVSKYKGKLYLV
jgi:hypothetical protein